MKNLNYGKETKMPASGVLAERALVYKQKFDEISALSLGIEAVSATVMILW